MAANGVNWRLNLVEMDMVCGLRSTSILSLSPSHAARLACVGSSSQSPRSGVVYPHWAAVDGRSKSWLNTTKKMGRSSAAQVAEKVLLIDGTALIKGRRAR